MSDINTILRKAAEYVAVTQPQLDKIASEKEAFIKQAAKTVAVMVHRGVIDKSKENFVLDKLAEDHSYALSLLENLTRIIGADQLGSPSNITKLSEDKADPFVREFMPELLNKSSLL